MAPLGIFDIVYVGERKFVLFQSVFFGLHVGRRGVILVLISDKYFFVLKLC